MLRRGILQLNPVIGVLGLVFFRTLVCSYTVLEQSIELTLIAIDSAWHMMPYNIQQQKSQEKRCSFRSPAPADLLAGVVLIRAVKECGDAPVFFAECNSPYDVLAK